MAKKIQRAEQTANHALTLARTYNLALAAIIKQHGGTLTLTARQLATVSDGASVKPLSVSEDGSVRLLLLEPRVTLESLIRWRFWRLARLYYRHPLLGKMKAKHLIGRFYWL